MPTDKDKSQDEYLFAVIDLALRVSQYMRSRNLVPEQLEYTLHSLLLDKKLGQKLKWPFGSTLGHIKNLYNNYAGLRRIFTDEDKELLQGITAIKAPRIEDKAAWQEIYNDML